MEASPVIAPANNWLHFVAETLRQDPDKRKIFNWQEISKIPLDDKFILEHVDDLQWELMSSYQPLSLAAIEACDKYINYSCLAKNPHLSVEVLKAKSDRMDWNTIQVCQKLTPTLLEHFADQIDPAIVLRHQKLTPFYIKKYLAPAMECARERRQLSVIKILFDLTLEYQQVPEDMLMEFLN